LEAIAAEAGGLPWTTNLEDALADPPTRFYFDAQITERAPKPCAGPSPPASTSTAQKPVAESLESALELCRLAARAGIKHGVVQDKLWLPGVLKLRALDRQGFFGRILSIRGEFGYWVFEGDTVPRNAPPGITARKMAAASFSTCSATGATFWTTCSAAVKAVSCLGATHIPRRWDEAGRPTSATADDSAYATFELEGGAVAHFNSSWAVRVRRRRSAHAAGGWHQGQRRGRPAPMLDSALRRHAAARVEPDVESPLDYFEGWQKVRAGDFTTTRSSASGVIPAPRVKDEPFDWGLLEGAKGVPLAEKG